MINSYMGDLVDRSKVEDMAFKRSGDKLNPQKTVVHYHKHDEPCAQHDHKIYEVTKKEADK